MVNFIQVLQGMPADETTFFSRLAMKWGLYEIEAEGFDRVPFWWPGAVANAKLALIGKGLYGINPLTGHTPGSQARHDASLAPDCPTANCKFKCKQGSSTLRGKPQFSKACLKCLNAGVEDPEVTWKEARFPVCSCRKCFCNKRLNEKNKMKQYICQDCYKTSRTCKFPARPNKCLCDDQKSCTCAYIWFSFTSPLSIASKRTLKSLFETLFLIQMLDRIDVTWLLIFRSYFVNTTSYRLIF